MSLDRKKRQLKILELVTTHPYRTQGELVEALIGSGWDVTQSSVSRDISQLGLVKVGGVYTRSSTRELKRISDPNERRLAESLLTVEPAGDALVVLHTPPGEAQRAGSAIDLMAWPEVAGNIAGDDTIFVAAKTTKARNLVLRRLRSILHGE